MEPWIKSGEVRIEQRQHYQARDKDPREEIEAAYVWWVRGTRLRIAIAVVALGSRALQTHKQTYLQSFDQYHVAIGRLM